MYEIIDCVTYWWNGKLEPLYAETMVLTSIVRPLFVALN